MNKEKLKEALGLFTDEEELRPAFRKPFRQGGYIVATDNTVIMRVEEQLLDGEDFESGNDYPDITNLFETCSNHTRKSLTLEKLKEAISKVPLIDQWEDNDVKCTECGGTGMVTYTYRGRHELYEKHSSCPVCNGHGILTHSVKMAEKVTDPYGRLALPVMGKLFYCGRWQKIAQAMFLLGIDKVEVSRNAASVVALDSHLGVSFMIIATKIKDGDFVTIKLED